MGNLMNHQSFNQIHAYVADAEHTKTRGASHGSGVTCDWMKKVARVF